MQVSQLVDWCKYVSAAGALDGVTITGGEPFYQPEPFLLFLQGLHQWREEQNLQFDILCYSGHNLQQLKKQHAEILGLLDAIIPEPYDASLPKGNHLCGSSNQQMICLTHLGQERYSSPNPSSSPSFQVAASGGKLWFIGIPEQRDMERIDTLCASKGLHFKEVSWRT
jgi:anaerobic ribonucleoside-triphosphate reductase activating protein